MSPRKPPESRHARATKAQETPDESAASAVDAAPTVEEPDSHPIFGLAPVKRALLFRIQYRNKTEIKLPLGLMDPWQLLDPSMLRDIHGPGRFRVHPLGVRGQLVQPPHQFDLEDLATGDLDLVSPMPDESGAIPSQGPPSVAAAPVVAAAVENHREKLLADLLSNQRAALDADRAWFSSTINALIAARGSSGGSETSNVYLQFLERDRARLATENEELRARVERLTLADARRGSGDDSFLAPLMLGAAQRFGIVPAGDPSMGRPRGAGAPPPPPARPAAEPASSSGEEGAEEGAEEGPGLGLPTVEAFRAYIQSGGTVPAAEVRAVVALQKVGAVPAELWELFRPIAEYYGLLS